ncbi:MAG: hypothetical protein GY811_06985, partial [Myxococcales bacterium]|nr:hypothetical protein [Myxococcales bacterium]
PWANGKHQLTTAYAWFLARWAQRLSWKETAEAFHTSCEKVFSAVSQAVEWGLAHRDLSDITAIGVDEVLWHRGHKHLTGVYQIDEHCKRLPLVSRSRCHPRCPDLHPRWVPAGDLGPNFEVTGPREMSVDFELVGPELRATVQDGWQPEGATTCNASGSFTAQRFRKTQEGSTLIYASIPRRAVVTAITEACDIIARSNYRAGRCSQPEHTSLGFRNCQLRSIVYNGAMRLVLTVGLLVVSVASVDAQADPLVESPKLGPRLKLSHIVRSNVNDYANDFGTHLGQLTIGLLEMRCDIKNRDARFHLGGGDPDAFRLRLDSYISVNRNQARVQARLDLAVAGYGFALKIPDFNVSTENVSGDRAVALSIPFLEGDF